MFIFHEMPFDLQWLAKMKITSQEKLKFSMLSIQEELEKEEAANIYVDATHLNEKARNKVLDRLDLRNADLYAVDFNMPLDVCIKQNALRSGRAFVPVSQVRRMWHQYDAPTENEKYKYTVLHAVAQKEKEDN